MNNKILLILLIFVIGCTNLQADSGFGSKRGVQMEFNYGFPSQGNRNPIESGETISARFLLNNYGSNVATGTVRISEVSGYDINLDEEPVSFNLQGIIEGVKAKDSAMFIEFRPFTYPKEAFNSLTVGVINLELDYSTMTEFSGNICIVSLTEVSSRGINNCQSTQTLNENNFKNANLHSVSIEKIEKSYIYQAVGRGMSTVKLDFYLKDYGDASSNINSIVRDFNPELIGARLIRCNKNELEFKDKKSRVSCEFEVATDDQSRNVPLKVTFSYQYKVIKKFDVPFQKEKT